MDAVVESLANLKISDRTKFQLEETSEKYDKYLKKLLELDLKKLKYFILNLKNRELINNQETEAEESFLIELYRLSQRKTSIDYTMELFRNGSLSKEDLKKVHQLVIKGSSDDLPQNYNFRSDNDKWVGSFSSIGERCIDYMPPEYEELPNLLNVVLEYVNDRKVQSYDDIFLNSLIMHVLVAYIQPFGNGNTRLARVLQHGKICTGTNELLKTDFKTPVLYLSKNYLLTREQYRNKIKEIAIKQDSSAWNSWFIYNLYMIDEQLYFLDQQLDSYKRIK